MTARLITSSPPLYHLSHRVTHTQTQGCDPSPAQWDELSQVLKAKKAVVFFDCAYQGFSSGDAEVDAYAIRKFVEDGHQIMISQVGEYVNM